MNRTSSSVWIVKGAASSIEVDKAVAITAVIRVFILVFPLVALSGALNQKRPPKEPV
jgi:hypothetical protein